jgi:aspartyl-tRNA(Asn)/glutamyl-tRNA(Gln) amidotransferase subunit A
MDLHKLTIPEAVKGLQSGQFTSVELTKDCLEQIKQTDGDYHAFITVDEKLALAQAKTADELIKSGEAKPLTGIPCSAKDVLATKDMKTTACSKMLEQYTPPYNATAIQKIYDDGGVIVGKNNCDEFAHGASTENSAFGPSKNPWDLTRVPGGSSGGSAAAVAGQQVFYSLGTDTGGSIRQPASFTGICALKPTYGRVSRHGLFSMTSSTDVIGPMARTVEGLAYIMEAIAGKDASDGTTLEKAVPPYHAELEKADLENLTIGVPKEYFTDALNPEVKKSVEEAIEWYVSKGATIKEVSLPHTEFAVAVYYIITPSEVSSNLARFDGIRYGYSVSTDESRVGEVESLEDVYKKTRRYGFGPEAKRRIMLGTYALSSGYYDAYYKQASKVRTLIRQDFEQVFKEVDVLLTPTSPKVAFKLGEQADDPLQMYMEDIFVAPASLAGLPALALPCGFAPVEDDATITSTSSPKKLPIGMQLIGPQFSETKLLQVGHAYQKETDWHQKKVRQI